MLYQDKKGFRKFSCLCVTRPDHLLVSLSQAAWQQSSSILIKGYSIV